MTVLSGDEHGEPTFSASAGYVTWALIQCARHARLCLIAGLLAGLALPGVAAKLNPWLPQMVAILLVLTALRIGLRAATGALGDLKWGLGAVLVLQMLVPLTALALFWAVGVADSPFALAVVLVTAAPAISGSPNLALLLGQDAGRMMQILILGTACFAITVLPILTLMPQLGTPGDLMAAALRVLVVILGSAAVGFLLRARLFPSPSPRQIDAMEGASVLAFSVIVVALMSALTPALQRDPWQVVLWAALAFGVGYGLQVLTLVSLRHTRLQGVAGPLAIGAGNRNIALFLVALPENIMAPLMVFIGCWQLPMYLTPILLPRLYRRMLGHD